MSITSGFFNSLNGDRKYTAEQMSAIFDGIINDGVFANIGTAFGVRAGSGNMVTVGIGRAWFNSTWVYNDSIFTISLDSPEVLLNRYDAIVIEVDRSDTIRNGTIKKVKGTASSDPQKPEMIKTIKKHQYPLAYIHVRAGSKEIKQADIINMVGSSSCPYVTGILKVVNTDNLLAQWGNEWEEWKNNLKSWISKEQADFEEWFENLHYLLTGDVAAKLIDEFLLLREKVEKTQEIVKVTLPTENWSNSFPYTQVIYLSGVTETDCPTLGIVYPLNCTPSTKADIDKAVNYIYDVETGNDRITIRCTKKPVSDITIGLKGITQKISNLQNYIRDAQENLILDCGLSPIEDNEM